MNNNREACFERGVCNRERVHSYFSGQKWTVAVQFSVCMGYESCREAMIKIWKTLKVDNFFRRINGPAILIYRLWKCPLVRVRLGVQAVNYCLASVLM